jgi:ribonuclease HII
MAVGVEVDKFHAKIISVKKRYVIGIDKIGRAAKKRRAPLKYIIGVDEVGRGALAGPVTVAALVMPEKLKIIKKENFPKLKDSKKLSSRQREIWFDYIKNNSKIFYAISSVSPKMVDRINISKAANLAATRAVMKLLAARKLVTRDLKIFLDGGLYLNIKSLTASGYWLKPKTAVKADEKIPAVALASIAAKVTRDKRMAEKTRAYPGFCFRAHKGYGTKKHFKEIKKNGATEIHRLSFL